MAPEPYNSGTRKSPVETGDEIHMRKLKSLSDAGSSRRRFIFCSRPALTSWPLPPCFVRPGYRCYDAWVDFAGSLFQSGK